MARGSARASIGLPGVLAGAVRAEFYGVVDLALGLGEGVDPITEGRLREAHAGTSSRSV